MDMFGGGVGGASRMHEYFLYIEFKKEKNTFADFKRKLWPVGERKLENSA